MKNLFILLLIFNGISLSLFAQKCKTDQLLQENIAENSTILEERQRINDFTERWITDHANQGSRSVYVVPKGT